MQKLKNNIGDLLSLKEEYLSTVNEENELISLVSKYVQELIDHDFEKLLWVLYRLDVNEQKVKETIDISGPQNAALEIAKLIVEREKEKILTRKKYKSDDENESDWIF